MARFNQVQRQFEVFLSRTVVPLLMQPEWFRYQVMRLRTAYIPRVAKAPDRKSWFRMVFEMIVLWIRWRTLPFHYFRYLLYERRVDLRKATRCLPDSVFYYRVLPRVNCRSEVLDDKILFKSKMATLGFPIPRTIIWGLGGCIWRLGCGSPIDDEQARSVLRREENFIFKPAMSSGGAGVKRLCFDGEQCRTLEGNTVALNEVLNSSDEWIIEEVLSQRKTLRELNASSVNTLRIVTVLSQGGTPRAIGAILRMGRAGEVCDNISMDGVYVALDAEGKAASRGYGDDGTYWDCHPDSGFPLAAIEIGDFAIARSLVEEAARTLPQVRVVGWDVAITDLGPVIIEGNSSPALSPMQSPDTEFGRKVLAALALCD